MKDTVLKEAFNHSGHDKGWSNFNLKKSSDNDTITVHNFSEFLYKGIIILW
mgnify:CR=1 FL=1